MNIDRKLTFSFQLGQFGTKFQVEGVAPNQSSCQKTRLNVLLCGMCVGRSFFPFVTKHTFHTETADGLKSLAKPLHAVAR